MASLVDTAEDDGRRSPDPGEPLALVYVGSAENDFAGAGRVILLPPAPTRVRFGRGPSLAVRQDASGLTVGIPLAWASGEHCDLEIVPADDGLQFELRDLGSRNGTLLEGRRVEAHAPLRLGRLFEIGRSFWTMRVLESRDDAIDGELARVMPPLRHAGRGLDKVARSDVPVLVTGETGTGKESIARAIHERSGRTGAFVHVGVSAFGPDRIEEEVGSGSRLTPGAARRSRGGTLYLADVDQLDARGQAGLLAALERLPKGDRGARIVAGSDRDLRKLASRGRFRSELYSRLAGFEVRLPPLRRRPEDVALLVRELGEGSGRSRLRLSTPAFRYLLAYTWPFNREQLRACLTAASMLPSLETVIGEQVVRDALRGARPTSVSELGSDSQDGPLEH